jgi:hypothetical protein
MNDEQIASMLLKAPAPEPPRHLLSRLERDVDRTLLQKKRRPIAVWAILQRWWPVAACLALSITALSHQHGIVAKLQQENETLRKAAASLEPSRLEFEQNQESAAALQRLLAAKGEIQTLTEKIATLKKSLDEMARLKAENDRLLKSLNLPPLSAEASDASERAYSQRCLNNLRNIALAGAIFAGDNDGKLPRDFLTITNELATPRILICPADAARVPRDPTHFDWKDYIAANEANNSYQMLTPDVPFARPSQADAKRVFVRCPIHGHVALIDGEVFRGDTNVRVVEKNGNWILEKTE